jgi:NAD-dependent SIR2 family protein deacetylase
MTQKIMSGDCSSCESTYSIEYMEEMVSQELPEHCPFCGEIIQELSEDYIDEDDELDDEEWD